MQIHSYDSNFFKQENRCVSMVHDWYSMSLLLNTQPYKLSYVLGREHRKNQHRKIEIKGRTVYQSSRTLGSLQSKMIPAMYKLLEQIPNNQMLAYRKGVNPYTLLQEEADKKFLIKFDIKKYYDHVAYKDIVFAMKKMGFSHKGAKLVARLSTVCRKIQKADGTDTTIHTLQQGSPVSPIISNLIGYWFIDRYIHEWIAQQERDYPNISWSFYRYSDNIAIFVDSGQANQIPLSLLRDFKSFVKNKLAESKFYTHKWAITAQTHPKMHMKFLGVILNKMARVSKEKFELWRSILFNACMTSVSYEAVKYWDQRGRDNSDEAWISTGKPAEIDAAKFMMVAQGTVNYVNQVNKKQGLQLRKLLKLARLTHNAEKWLAFSSLSRQDIRDWVYIKPGGGSFAVPNVNHVSKQRSNAFLAALKTFKKGDETEEEFLKNVAEAS